MPGEGSFECTLNSSGRMAWMPWMPRASQHDGVTDVLKGVGE